MESVSTLKASNIQIDYMKLLTTQLRYQNPLDPLDNNDMASQLALFSQLQQLESLSSSFGEVLASTKRSYANSLIGKDVTYIWGNELIGAAERKRGEVGEVYALDGNNFLVIDRYTFGLKDIAESLAGKQILYLAETPKGTKEVRVGEVNGAYPDIGEGFLLVDGSTKVALKDVIGDSLRGQNIWYTAVDELTGVVENKGGTINEVYKTVTGEDIFIVGRIVDLENVISVRD